VRRWIRLALVVWVLGVVPGTSRAQDPPRPSSYPGVVPGTGNAPPAIERLGARRGRARVARSAILTWPGFQVMPGGGSRFFVQTTGPVVAQLRAAGDRVEVVFPNTGIHLANSARWLETRHFNTPVARARLERRGRDMVFVMHLRGPTTPRVWQASGEGPWSYTYIEFDPGQWLPPEPAPAAEPRGGSVGFVGGGSARDMDSPVPQGAPQPGVPAPQQLPRRLDDERPPPVRGPTPKR
jgi:hypothetical protein